MAIISILMAVLMPTLNRARELVRSVVCKANEKGLHAGFSMYAAAWNDQIPPTGGYWTGGNWKTKVDPYWYDNLGRAGYIGAGEQFTDKWGGTAINRRYLITHCPAEGAPLIPYNSINASGQYVILYDMFYVHGSYAMNMSVSRTCYGSTVVHPNCYRPGWSQGPGDPNYTASSAMIVTDQMEKHTGAGRPCYHTDIDGCPPEALVAANSSHPYYAFRHPDKTANFMFMDGHIGPRKHYFETDQKNYQDLWHQDPPSRR